MHSSRMRTVRNSSRLLGDACSGGCLLQGVPAPGGACSGGVPALRGCLLQGVGACSGGCLLLEGGRCLLLGEAWWYPSMHLGRPPVDRQTGVKT